MGRDLVFWDAPISGNTYKVRLLLAQLALPHRAIRLDIAKGAVRAQEFREVNPFGRVPFLEDGDFGLAESNAILLYLARGTPLLPEDRRLEALVHQWMFFEQNQIELSIGVPRFRLRFAKDAPSTASVLEFWRPRAADALSILDRHFSKQPFAVGGAYSVADIALFGYTQVAGDAQHSLGDYPAVVRWLDRVRATPRFIPMTE